MAIEKTPIRFIENREPISPSVTNRPFSDIETNIDDIIEHINETEVIAGDGLVGGGTLGSNITLSADFGTGAGKVTEGNDERLSNAREWTAETVSQAEAEAGTGTTRRAWTAQRVRQAIVAAYNALTSAFGRTLANASDATAARNTLGLGTAAARDVTTGLNDLTAGRLATIEQVRRYIGGPSAIYTQRVVLLHPVYNGGDLLPLHIVDGTISAFRGNTNSLNIAEKVYVVSSSSYDNNNIRVFSVGIGPSSTWEPVTCLYGGTKYIALKMPFMAPGYGSGVYFEGRTYSQSSDPNILKIVDYYDEQAQTVLNAEIYNSITPASAVDHFRIGNSIAYHTGNMPAATQQEAEAGTSAALRAWSPLRVRQAVNAATGIPSGTRMLFLQASAPSGWTQVTNINDRVLRVVSGTGGGTGGSWTISGLSASVGNTTLSLSQTPSHTHPISNASNRGTYAQWNSQGARSIDGGSATGYSGNTVNTNAVGGSGAHSHSASISSNGSWRPAYVDVIVCTKD